MPRSTAPSSSPAAGANVTPRKRKAAHEAEEDRPSSTKRTNTRAEEKRLKPLRKHAPKTFLRKLERAQTQRMIVIGRTRGGTAECPTECVDIVGTTGNVYRVTIDRVPACTCPDSQKGHECKHKVYVLATVLRAPYAHQYQRALLSTELKAIFDRAPPIPAVAIAVAGTDDDDDAGNNNNTTSGGTRIANRRRPVEGECPICYMELDAQHNELVWCRAACGNNMHKACFEQWAAASRRGGAAVRCVYCRSAWEPAGTGAVNAEGYVNVARQYGMSGIRDYSSYHQPWVRRFLT